MSFATEAREKLEAARNIAKAAEQAARNLTDDEQNRIGELLAEGQDLRAKAAQAKANQQSIADLGAALEESEAVEINAKALDGTRRGLEAKAGSLGAQFTTSSEFKAMTDTFAGGRPGRDQRIQSAPMNVEGGLKALITTGQATATSDSSASVLVEPHKLGLVPYPYVAPTLRNVVTTGTTTSDRIEYAQLLPNSDPKVVNAAAGVKESPAITGTVGVKPQSGFGFRKASAEIITLAHWLPVTKQALSDAGQIRTIIDAFLRRGLEEEIERQIIEGNKDAPTKGEEEFEGIFNTTGVQNQAFDGDVFRTVRKAISKVTKLGGQVTSILVSPELDEEIDLAKDANERFYGAGPFSLGPNTLWGRPRIVTPALSGKGKFVLGDLSQCVLWDREQATITATDSHADFFIRNLVAILAEARAGFGILNPTLLVLGDEKAA